MPLRAEFEMDKENVILMTQVNGDRIELNKIHLGADAAKNLAELINTQSITTVKVIIKEPAAP